MVVQIWELTQCEERPYTVAVDMQRDWRSQLGEMSKYGTILEGVQPSDKATAYFVEYTNKATGAVVRGHGETIEQAKADARAYIRSTSGTGVKVVFSDD